MLGEVVGEGRGIEPAATQPEPLTERFGGLEQVVRDRKSDFHTWVLPWYETSGKRAPASVVHLNVDGPERWSPGVAAARDPVSGGPSAGAAAVVVADAFPASIEFFHGT